MAVARASSLAGKKAVTLSAWRLNCEATVSPQRCCLRLACYARPGNSRTCRTCVTRRSKLFCGGSYSVAGLASARAAHQLAVIRGLARGNAIPPEVLADYPQVMQSRHRKKPPDYPPDVFAASRWSNFHRIFRARGRVRVPVACRRLSRVRFRPARPSLACSPADSWRWPHRNTAACSRETGSMNRPRPLSCACAHRAGRDRRRDPRRNGSGGPACRRPSAASV